MSRTEVGSGTAAPPTSDEGNRYTDNPLFGDSDDTAGAAVEDRVDELNGSRAGPKEATPPPISTAERVNFAKILRRSKEQEAENQILSAEVQELRTALASAGENVESFPLAVSFDTTTAEASAKKAGGKVPIDEVAESADEQAQTRQPQSSSSSQAEELRGVTQLRAYAADELLQEETRAAAKLAVDSAVTSQLEVAQYQQNVEQRIVKKRLLAQEMQQTKAVNQQLSTQHLETLRQRNANAFQVAQGKQTAELSCLSPWTYPVTSALLDTSVRALA